MTDWEYIIVDDASQDSSASIAERAASGDGRIRVLRRVARGGPYVAANEGLAAARGRYVARLDADDVAAPDRLERQHRFLAANPDVRACGGFHQAISADGERVRPAWRFVVAPGVLRWRLCFAADPAHSSLFAERSALDEIGGYGTDRLAQDWRLWCELSRRGWLGIVPDVVVERRVHDERLGERERPQQIAAANDVAREHILALTGEEWGLEQVQALRDVAHARRTPMRRGLAALDRWVRGWRADASLSIEEEATLARWTSSRRRRHVLASVGTVPIVGPAVRAGVAAYDGARQRSNRAGSGRGSSP